LEADLTCLGADVDDPAVAALDHVPAGGLAGEEKSLEVDVEDLVPLLFGRLEGVVVGAHAGVVDENRRAHIVDRGPDGGDIAEVESDCLEARRRVGLGESMTVRAPAPASARASSRPMPSLAPVTSATCPSSCRPVSSPPPWPTLA
jgi:hypothetical protein